MPVMILPTGILGVFSFLVSLIKLPVKLFLVRSVLSYTVTNYDSPKVGTSWMHAKNTLGKSDVFQYMLNFSLHSLIKMAA